MIVYFFILLNLLILVKSDVEIAITMMIRDEAVNIRSNLALWLPVIDYFVFIVDSRNTDESKDAIHKILEGKAKGFKIFGLFYFFLIF